MGIYLIKTEIETSCDRIADLEKAVASALLLSLEIRAVIELEISKVDKQETRNLCTSNASSKERNFVVDGRRGENA